MSRPKSDRPVHKFVYGSAQRMLWEKVNVFLNVSEVQVATRSFASLRQFETRSSRGVLPTTWPLAQLMVKALFQLPLFGKRGSDFGGMRSTVRRWDECEVVVGTKSAATGKNDGRMNKE